MAATQPAPAPAVTASPAPALTYVPLERIEANPNNPRRRRDPAKLGDLVDSIRAVGVLEPLLVRPVGKNGRYQVIAGDRRRAAALQAGLADVPVVVRQVTDQEALELAIVENLQREDVHPLDEADGYRALMQADRAYTPEAIAAKVGKSKSYVYQRLKLAALEPGARKAFEEERITAGHAILIARLQPADQARALAATFEYAPRSRRPNPFSVRELMRWIEDSIHLDLHGAPWRKDELGDLDRMAEVLHVNLKAIRAAHAKRAREAAARAKLRTIAAKAKAKREASINAKARTQTSAPGGAQAKAAKKKLVGRRAKGAAK